MCACVSAAAAPRPPTQNIAPNTSPPDHSSPPRRHPTPAPTQQCDAGEPPKPPAQLVTHWQRYLYGDNVVGLVRVLGFTEHAIGGEMT